MVECVVIGCSVQAQARGMCMGHYNRVRRYGDPRADVPVVRRDYSRSLEERFWSKVQRLGPSECWPWMAFRNPKGYGIFGMRVKARYRAISAQRVAYMLMRGRIPDGFVIDHLCRNRGCCNPDHLEAVTAEENTKRGDAGVHWAAKTHCPKSHPYDAANTYVQKGKYRGCRACGRDATRRWQERQRELRSRALSGSSLPLT